MSSNPTDPAVRLLAERLWKDHDSQYSSDHLTWVDFEPEARGHLRALADAGLPCSSPDVQPQDDEGRCAPMPSAPRVLPAGVAEVLGFVSRGRGYVGCEPYPDATARRVLAELQDGGWIQ